MNTGDMLILTSIPMGLWGVVLAIVIRDGLKSIAAAIREIKPDAAQDEEGSDAH